MKEVFKGMSIKRNLETLFNYLWIIFCYIGMICKLIWLVLTNKKINKSNRHRLKEYWLDQTHLNQIKINTCKDYLKSNLKDFLISIFILFFTLIMLLNFSFRDLVLYLS